jgi:hypothetical protein
MKIPKIITVSYSISRFELDKHIQFMRSQVIDKIYKQLAVELHDGMIREIDSDNEYIKTFDFKAYVVTPSELEQMIQEGVQKRMAGYPTGIMY